MNMEKTDFSIRVANRRISRLVYLLKLLGIAALYALLAKIVLTLFSANGVVSIVWPPSGLALAVLLMGGKRYFPGVFLGAFLANAMTGLALGVAAAIAMGNTLEALLGAWLLTRGGRFDSNLRTLRDYLRLVVLAGFVACSVAALNGSTTLLVSGFITSETYLQNLLHWWMGDALGIVMITPLILVWRRIPDDWLEPKRMAEAVFLFLLTFLAGQIVFLGWFHGTDGLFAQVARGYWIFLVITLVAVRLGTHGVLITLIMTAIQALFSAALGVGFFADDIAKTGLINCWFYIVALSMVAMALATHFTERKQIEEALRKSEARFRNILEHAPIGMAIASLDGRLMQVNQALCIILGYEKEELEKLTIREITHTEDVASSFANIKRLLDGELDYYQLEKRYIRKDGQAMWAQLSASIERDDSGAPRYFIGQIEDITERKRAGELLRKSSEEIEDLYNHAPCGYHSLDKDGIIRRINDTELAWLGYTRDEVIGRMKWTDLITSAGLPTFRENFPRLKKLGFAHDLEFELIRKDGTMFTGVINATAVYDASGNYVTSRSTLFDITERKQAEDELKLSAQLLNSTSDTVFLLDPEGNFVYLNEAAWKSRGYTRDEMMGMNLRELNAPEYNKLLAPRIKAVMEKGQGFFESAHRCKDGSVMPVEINVRVTESGGRKLLLSVIRDITERKRSEEKLAAAHKELESIIEAQPDILYVINTKGELIKWNSALEKLCGLSPEMMMKRPAAEFVCEEDRPTVYNGIREVFEKGSAFIEVRFIRGDGVLVPHLCSGAVWKSPGGEVLGFIGVGRDMTERKKLDEELELFRLMVEKSGDPIFMIDDDDGCRMMYVNEAAVKHYGTTREEILTWRIPDWDPNFSYEMLAQHVEEIKKLKNLTIESLHRIKGGSIVPVEISLNYLIYKGRHCHFGYFRNITERKKYEEELRRSNAELEQFSYAVSHDMRQPLRMISSYLQLIEMSLADQLDGEKRGYFNFAIDGAKRIDQMLMALLEYSRVGRMDEPPMWIESRAVLDEALLFLQPAIAAAQARLNITGDWPRIFASHDEILRLLQNLIGNAAKYRIAGRIPEITVTGEMVRNEWRLCVADNGVGIIPDQINRLFKVFQRLQTRAAYEGTGIGLALCRKIAEHHKGRIWAESAGEGQGSKFCIVLPVPGHRC